MDFISIKIEYTDRLGQSQNITRNFSKSDPISSIVNTIYPLMGVSSNQVNLLLNGESFDYDEIIRNSNLFNHCKLRASDSHQAVIPHSNRSQYNNYTRYRGYDSNFIDLHSEKHYKVICRGCRKKFDVGSKKCRNRKCRNQNKLRFQKLLRVRNGPKKNDKKNFANFKKTFKKRIDPAN